MNKNDSLLMQQLLADAGFEPTADPDSADIHIVNTCTVRQHAANRALSYIAGLKRWHDRGGRVLCVTGCLAQAEADEISRRMAHVDLILGTDAYQNIGDHIKEIIAKKVRLVDTRVSNETYCGIYHPAAGVADFVAIMRGCSNYCSYCIVPNVRGPARSRPYEDIRGEITYLIERGVKDITLLGQNVNEYRHNDLDFAGLLERVAKIPGTCRIRFLTSHPKDFSIKTVQVIEDYCNICEWCHLPLQSGSNRILSLMNRRYTKEQYLDLVRNIRDRIPQATVTTDVIAGFPTETDEEFLETIALLEQLRFDDAYMYRYSPRPGTKASELTPLAEEMIKERLSALIAVQTGIVKEKTHEMLGKEYEVLFESAAKQNGSRGKTRGNKDVVVRGHIEPGTIKNVVIKEIKGHTPIAEPVD
ncbi:tRNA (N6-isopentenyl adenosine(37)-C2)-methylthiotransferase MiaB [candidate division WOR-3 bacterium]|nr:tRNA (N6-isopentenyl adenosine(37)-C2)-methylthiotransferase MiaB [candidate division WOR-3 bacterium]